MRRETEATLEEVFARLLPQLDERQRRLALGAAARVVGYGGIRRVARLVRVAESTVARGARELAGGGRAPGGCGHQARAASGCGTVTRAWSRRCWRWSNPISAAIRNPRCAGPPSRHGTWRRR